MLVNRIGDVFFILAIVLILLSFKTTDYSIVFLLLPYKSTETLVFLNNEILLINLITFFLFLGAITKSAQIGMHI